MTAGGVAFCAYESARADFVKELYKIPALFSAENAGR
jgi:hypothetical protein